MSGPPDVATAASVTTAIPSDTVLLGISLADGVATIDLSREFEGGASSSSMSRRIAQVVYTLTQFPTITSVRLHLDGQPVPLLDGDGRQLDRPAARDDYLGLLPAIFVDAPGSGGSIGSSALVTGRANVFEARFQLELSDASGRVIAHHAVMASCGTGCWGTFNDRLSVSSGGGSGFLTVWSASAVDGSRENIRRYPVLLGP